VPEIIKSKTIKKKITNPLFEAKPKNFSIGQDIQPKRDLTRFVKWPKYIRFQRNKSILKKRLKMPASINQFNNAIDKPNAKAILKLLSKYRPESKGEKSLRLKLRASERVEGKAETIETRPAVLRYGIREITSLVENKKAQMVIIAHDVDPIEIVMHLPNLCRKMGVAYCIIKGKSVLGQIVRQKTCSAVALVNVNAEDKPAMSKLTEIMMNNFNNRGDEIRKHVGGGVMGMKAQAKILKIKKIQERETAVKCA